MPNPQEQILLGARVPLYLKERLHKYCLSHGIKMGYFVAEAIREKLLEIAEDNRSIAVARERLKAPEFISQKEFDKYLVKREIKP